MKVILVPPKFMHNAPLLRLLQKVEIPIAYVKRSGFGDYGHRHCFSVRRRVQTFECSAEVSAGSCCRSQECVEMEKHFNFINS